MNPGDRAERDRELVARALDDYAVRRISFYQRVTLKQILAKDVLMYAVRGVQTAQEFLNQAFAALESSSEETNMGTTWQQIIKDLAWPSAIDAGDVMAERDGSLWVVEIKAQTNTLNSSSSPQTLRSLKDRVEYHGAFQPARRQSVRAMIGVLRGPSADRIETYRHDPRRAVNRDLDGFSYRYVVGSSFWVWLTGRPSVVELLGDFDSAGKRLRDARRACVERLGQDLDRMLRERGLVDDIQSVLRIAYGERR